jgi:hypothetical protein
MNEEQKKPCENHIKEIDIKIDRLTVLISAAERDEARALWELEINQFKHERRIWEIKLEEGATV